VAQREFDMGYKSVAIIYLISTKGIDVAFNEMGVVNGVIDTGVDIVTQTNLKNYEIQLDARGIPHKWSAEDWWPDKDEVDQWK
jgi:ribose transport system substrate-binding protein